MNTSVLRVLMALLLYGAVAVRAVKDIHVVALFNDRVVVMIDVTVCWARARPVPNAS
jgi:hypothetical protein